VIELTEPRAVRRISGLAELRQFAAEALAIHQEHREQDLTSARELALFALEEADGRRADGVRHRLARLDRKIARRSALEERQAAILRFSRPPITWQRQRSSVFLVWRRPCGLDVCTEPLGEPLNAAFGIYQLLPAREEWMTVVADLG
jgi:hypothetical protein